MSPPSPFYLGRIYDPAQGKAAADQPLFYNPDDLVTHAVVTGMTGSGKTGLCIALLEEAAMKGVPAILVDPKGDLTNLLLHFPGLTPAEFQPWLDADAARRQGASLDSGCPGDCLPLAGRPGGMGAGDRARGGPAESG